MQYINQANQIRIKWTVMKSVSACKEDFSNAEVYMFLHHQRTDSTGIIDRLLLSCEVEDSVVIADISDTLEVGVFGVSLLWIKNNDHVPGSRCIMRSRVDDVFAITDNENEAEVKTSVTVVTLKTQAGSYGYDGLDAYELAVLKGVTTLTEEEWLTACNTAITSGAHLATAYDDTATYAVGDYVSYDGDVYVCSTAVTTAGDFDSDYWTICTPVMEYVDGLIESVEEQTVGSLSVTAGSSSVVLDILDTEGNTLASGTIDYPTEDTAGVIRTEAVATTDLSGYTDDALGNYVGALIAKIATTSDYGVTKALSYYSEDTDAYTSSITNTAGFTVTVGQDSDNVLSVTDGTITADIHGMGFYLAAQEGLYFETIEPDDITFNETEKTLQDYLDEKADSLSYYTEDTDAGTATLSATSGVTIEATDSGAELALTGYSTTITAGADNLTLDAGSNYVAMVATNGAKVNGYAVATTLPVTITDDGGSYESDTTYTDIITAIDAGVDVVVNSTDSQSEDNLIYRFTGMSGTSYVFTTFDLTNAAVRGLVMSSTGSWTDFSYTLS